MPVIGRGIPRSGWLDEHAPITSRDCARFRMLGALWVTITFVT
jgi:hypothetical protein